MKQDLQLSLKGITIGIANIIPGVSGGTMAVVMGIYDNLIQAISEFFSRPEKRLQHIRFIAFLGFGAVVGILLFAKLMGWALETYPQQTMLFFMGLILGSLPAVIKMSKITPFSKASFFAISLGVLAVLGLGDHSIEKPSRESIAAKASTQETIPEDYTLLIASGVAAGGAMIVPGISGSLVLLLLNQYERILQAINERNLVVIGIVGISAVLGILIFARLIHFATRSFPQLTHGFIIGLVGGSVIILYQGMPPSAIGIISSVVLFTTGNMLAFILGD